MVIGSRTHHGGNLHADGIGHHRALLLVGEQYPVLSFRHPEGLYFLFEFQSVGVFCPGVVAPAGVSPSLDLHLVFHRGVNDASVDIDVGVEVIALAADKLEILDVDVYPRHVVGLVGEPVHMHRVVPSPRDKMVVIHRGLDEYGDGVGVLSHL